MTTSPITAGNPMLSDELFKLDLHIGDPLRGAAAESGEPLQPNGPNIMNSPANGWGADLIRPGDVLILPAGTQSEPSDKSPGTTSLPYRAEGMSTNLKPLRAEGDDGAGITEPTSAGTQGTGGGDILALPYRAEGAGANAKPLRAEGDEGEGITEPTSAGTQSQDADALKLPYRAEGAGISLKPLRAEGGEGGNPEAAPAGNLLSNAQQLVDSARAMTQQFAQPVADAGEPGSPVPQGHFHT